MIPTILAAAAELRGGRRTPVDLVDFCLERINRYEPQVHAWVLVDREGARAEAERLTAEARNGQWRGPLHGIPLGIKDIFDVYDWPTTGGSRRWAQSIARRDATVVRRLREAGAIFLGKTVTTPFASFDPPVTGNPWDRTRTPGGSSSGSAAALACGMCLGALGSQTGGSIARPASYCGVAGCKPTYGRVSGEGVMPLAASMDHPGPMGRCVRDLAILLQAIAGVDPADPATGDQPVPDLMAELERAYGERRGVSPPCSPSPRVGRVRGLFEELAEPAMRTLMDRVDEKLQERGAPMVNVALPAGFAEVVARHRTVMAVEAARYHEVRFRRHPEDYPPRIRGLIEEGLACSATEYARCKEHQARLTTEMAHCFGGVDVLLTPATRGAAPAADTTGDPAFNSPWSYTGLPTVSFPAGWNEEGLPLAIQLIGRAWDEARLFRAAAWCEAAVALEQREPAQIM
jgi:aspartyl-tRNA(Asn)/glutamyl-tRNA(Gln) amidotransferase subunit A